MAMRRSRWRSGTQSSSKKGIKTSTVGTIKTMFTLIDDHAASTKIDGFDAESEAINTPLHTQFVKELAVTIEYHLRGPLVHERSYRRSGSARMYDTVIWSTGVLDIMIDLERPLRGRVEKENPLGSAEESV